MEYLNRIIARLVRREIEARGRQIVPRIARNGRELSVLALLIEHCVQSKGKGAVVQIGANDGLMSDPVRQSIVSLGLPALLVEPLPDIFSQLQRNYAAQTDIVFENVGIDTTAGEAEIYRVSPASPDLPAWVHGLASFDKAVLLKHRNWDGVRGLDLDRYIESIKVPVLTMRQLLDRHPGLRPVLVLQIDTEGYDFKVIQSAVEAGCLPPIINYEHKHLLYEEQWACRELLTDQGYSLSTGTTDTVAYRDRLVER